MLEVLGGIVIERAKGLAVKQAVELMETLLANDRALNFATERLREKYEQIVTPAPYDYIASNFRLSPQDFLEYFKTAEKASLQSLTNHLRARLRTRASNWVHNRPTEQVFDEMVEAFFRAYESYFITADPKLATLRLVGASNDILEIVAEIRTSVAALAAQQTSPSPHWPFLNEISAFLATLQIPFEVLEKTSKHLDLLIVDASGLFPSRIFINATVQVLDESVVDQIAERMRANGRFAHSFIVSPGKHSAEAESSAQRRGITLISLAAFRQNLLKISPGDQFVFGPGGGIHLLESLAVHEVYIPPHCHAIDPTQADDDPAPETRVDAFGQLDAFLRAPAQRLLVVLGDYGSGKSAFCAQVHARLSAGASGFTPIFISLKQLRKAEDLPRTVLKATQISKLLAPTESAPLVILDGVDEMPNAMEPRERRHNLLRLIECAQIGSKILVSVRSSYFKGLADFWNLFSTANSDKLLNKISAFYEGRRSKIEMSAMVLSEFNNDQIAEYIRAYARSRGKEADFTAKFLEMLSDYDPKDVYRNLARSPLYLFLLINTEPWKDENVACLGDVLRVLIQFWFERDIEKGPSRWLLTIADRFEFVSALAWRMFTESKLMISFDEFDRFVKEFYRLDGDEHQAIAIDLHTTGLFSCSGDRLHFAMPALMDYFVARKFIEGDFAKFPLRLPTANQARIWLGLLETKQTNSNSWNSKAAEQWLAKFGVRETHAGFELIQKDTEIRFTDSEIKIEATGIIYAETPKGWRWPIAHLAENKYQRMIIYAALAQVERSKGNVIRVLIANRMGIHARPAACITLAFRRWLKGFTRLEIPRVLIGRDGEAVEAMSVMGLMMLAASKGTVLELFYENCSRDEVEDVLVDLRAKKAEKHADFDWLLDDSSDLQVPRF